MPFDGRIVEYRSFESSAAPFLDTVTVEGEVVVPVDLVNIGHWLRRGGAALAQVTGAWVAYSNSVEAVPTIRADGKIEGADSGIARATGQITARFAERRC